MPIQLTLSQVRAAIYRQAGVERPPDSSATRWLKRLFLDCVALLMGTDERYCWQAAVDPDGAGEPQACERLEAHCYETILGPRLARQQAGLQGSGQGVLDLWHALRAFCQWWVRLQWSAGKPAARVAGADSATVQVASAEHPMVRKLHSQGWSDMVELSDGGQVAVFGPSRPCWYLLEYDPGQAHAEADLALACLYRLLLAAPPQPGGEAVALLRFRPALDERLFDSAALLGGQNRLLRLIAHLSGLLSSKPAVDLGKSDAGADPFRGQAERIVALLGEFGQPMVLTGEPLAGPAFMRYPVRLAAGGSLEAARRIAPDVQPHLRLAAPPLLQMAEERLVLDIPRPDRRKVSFDKLRAQIPKPKPELGGSKVMLGLDLNRRLRFADLAEPASAHFLVAGDAGSGKSEWLRCALAGLLLTNTPETLRLVLIDPKGRTFAQMQDSPFLWWPFGLVESGSQSVAAVLAELCGWLDERHRQLRSAGCEQRDAFVSRTRQPMSRLLFICDEYADLVPRDPGERRAVKQHLTLLGAKGPAVGIHLMLATRRTVRQALQGVLDAFIPARVGLKMAHQIGSQWLLGCTGAEHLLGSGDLFYRDLGDPRRLQAPLLSDEECQEIFGRR